MAVSKQEAQKFDEERFDLRKLSKLNVKKQCHIKFSNRFAASENLNYSKDINRAWKNVKENIKTSVKESLVLYEFKHHKPWFEEDCSQYLDSRKWAKMHWLQDPSQSSVDKQNNIKCEYTFQEQKERIS